MSTTAHVGSVSQAYPLRLRPERKIWRVGTPYLYRHPKESLAMAAGAFLSAQYRITHNQVVRFNAAWLAQRLDQAKAPADQWAMTMDYLLDIGVPTEGTFLVSPWLPRRVLYPETLDELVSVLAEVGPVLALIPWSPIYDHQSRAYGTDWIGPDGTGLRSVYATEHRGVLLKGVAWKFRGIRVQDGARPDLWMPFAEVSRLFGEGAHFMTGVY